MEISIKMEHLTKDLENLKISALSKLKLINEELALRENEKVQLEGENKQTSYSKAVQIFEKERIPPIPKTNPDLPLKRLITQLESERQKEVHHAISERINQMSEFTRHQEQMKKENWRKQRDHIISSVYQEESSILSALEKYEKQTEEEHNRLVDYYQKQAEKQKKNMQVIEEKERARRELGEILDDIKRNQMEARIVYQDIATLTKSQASSLDLKTHLSSYTPRLKQIIQAMEDIIGKCKAGKVNREDGEHFQALLNAMKESKKEIEEKVKSLQVEKEQKMLQQQKHLQQQQQQQQEQALIHQQQLGELEKQQLKQQQSQEGEVEADNLKKFVNPTNFQIYTKLIVFLKDYKLRYADLQTSSNHKQHRENFTKAINITVNTISSVSRSHLLDKYNKLHSLLSGRQIIVGDAPVNASSHQQGVYYCTDLLAQKLVAQGDVTISTNPESAFCYAAIIVALWNDFPEFGKLLLAHLYKTCPCLLPFYVPRRADQTQEDYCKTLGYKFINGVAEERVKYLQRLSGLIRLYSAIFITKPKSGQNRNPHGLNMAWKWLSSVLNLEPRLDVTATMLHVFLETAGVCMHSAYGKEFVKVLMFVRNVYLPILKKEDSGGPVSRLEVLLQEYTTNKQFQKPRGILPNNFW